MISERKLLHAYRPTALLKVTGEDAFTFLQGQFTNELHQPIGAAVYGLWLNHKGKVVADSHALRLGEKEFILASITSPADSIRQKLEAFIVADDVMLKDETAAWYGLALSGPGCGEAIKQVCGEIPRPGHFIQSGGGMIFSGRRVRAENYEIIGPEEIIVESQKQLTALGCMEVGAAEMERARIASGLPAIPQDLGPADLPNEGGLAESAISYTKGCYLGQEVMARLKNMGKVRRRLHVVVGAGAPPAPNTPLYQGEKKVGELRSNAAKGNEFVALAMLSLLNLEPRTGLSVAPGATPTLRIIPHG